VRRKGRVTRLRTHQTIEKFPVASPLERSVTGTSHRSLVYMATNATRMRMMVRYDRDAADDIGAPRSDARCAELREAVWSYLDDESSWDERRWIRAHITACSHCRAYLRFQRAFLRALRTELSREEPDEALRERIRTLLRPGAPSSESGNDASNENWEPPT
jgi:anti-sigma factor (TIGR02949 family)